MPTRISLPIRGNFAVRPGESGILAERSSRRFSAACLLPLLPLLTLCASVVLASSPPAAASGRLVSTGQAATSGRAARPAFRDVPSGHWAAKAVQELAQRGILKPAADRTFKGEQPVTRYELALALYRMVRYLEVNRPGGPHTGSGSGGSAGSGAGIASKNGTHSRGATRQRQIAAHARGTAEGPGPGGPAAWLVARNYLTADSILARPPSSATVSPGLLADSLAYVTDRVLLHRSTPEELKEQLDNSDPTE